MRHTIQKGFTLVEMITVLAIFGIISSIVIFNYGKFQSDTILTNMAYEVALSIREAQVYGVSARTTTGASADFKTPYGIYFAKDSKEYILFSDGESSANDSKFSGTSCVSSGGDTCVTPYTLQRNVIVGDIKVKSASCESKTSASILFERPNPEPIISVDPNENNISVIEIELQAPEGSTRYVAVYNNGQITVINEKTKTQCYAS